MAAYKVPQDVEADDKLIGPFSFRQFIYLIVVAIAIFIAWVLSKIFIGLILIPLPVILFFGALALPLRKDQPMETYVVAIIRFFLKPRIRIWSPDGQLSHITITAPQILDDTATKGFTSGEAEQRLSYLAQVIDTKGWSSRGVLAAPTSLTDTIAAEAQHAEDVFGDDTFVAQSFDQLIKKDDARRRSQAISQLHPVAPTQATSAPQPQATTSMSDEPAVKLDYNPYPSNMRQHVVMPVARQNQGLIATEPPLTSPPVVNPPKAPVTPAVSPDIIRLANNNDLSISAIANEAHRLGKNDGEEVVISLH